MESFLNSIVKNLTHLNWEGPAIFAIIFLVFLAVFRKWSILLLTLLTIVLGWGAQDLIITNIASYDRIASVPLVIYCVGGAAIIILLLISFLRS